MQSLIAIKCHMQICNTIKGMRPTFVTPRLIDEAEHVLRHAVYQISSVYDVTSEKVEVAYINHALVWRVLFHCQGKQYESTNRGLKIITDEAEYYKWDNSEVDQRTIEISKRRTRLNGNIKVNYGCEDVFPRSYQHGIKG